MKHLFLFLLTLVGAGVATAAVPASVSRAVKQVNAAKSLDVTCTINGRPASMTLSGENFILDLGDAKIYFDGKTQWSYSAADNEVTIFEPTADELAQSNPLQILRRLASDYNGAPAKGSPDSVRLTPVNKQSDIAEATVTFDPASGWPVAMTLITGSGRADIKQIKFTPSQTARPASAFRFTAPAGATVSDLR